jgi:hypothetical protein
MNTLYSLFDVYTHECYAALHSNTKTRNEEAGSRDIHVYDMVNKQRQKKVRRGKGLLGKRLWIEEG